MKNYIYLIFLFALAFNVSAQNEQSSYFTTNTPESTKLSRQNASAAANSNNILISMDSAENVSNLVYQLRYGHLNNHDKTMAIYNLGELRPNDTNSIEILIENIDFRATTFDPKTDIQRWGYYPAEEALMKIGKPVVIPILNHLPSETNQLRRQLMCDVLRHVELKADAQSNSTNNTNQVQPNVMMASIRSDKWNPFDDIALKLHDERQQAIRQLIDIFQDKKSSNFQQCAAAYYLGEWRASEASDALAANISLSLIRLSNNHLEVLGLSAVRALVEIGNPSIPAVIRNLAESDDAKVRELSLKVLYRIEGDKDIVQLRLQKALNIEKDPQKQVRLQAALKSLAETQF